MAVSTLCHSKSCLVCVLICRPLSADVKEYAQRRHRLFETFSECIDKVGSLLRAQASDARNRRATEAMLFIRLAYTFNQDAYLAGSPSG